MTRLSFEAVESPKDSTKALQALGAASFRAARGQARLTLCAVRRAHKSHRRRGYVKVSIATLESTANRAGYLQLDSVSSA